MRTSTCLLPKVLFTIALGLSLFAGQGQSTHAQSEGVVPASYQSGSFFNKKLGTSMRFNYHTQGYGTQGDVFSLGGMKIFNLDDATVFVDGQGTLSEDFGGGFNFGVGYRQLATLGMMYDAERVLGVGFWTDGQSTASDNFFTQLGFSLESLGESYDLRLNGHFPLERTQESDAVLTGGGTPFYSGNNIFGTVDSVTVDTAHSVVDGEFAKRIKDLDAWAFVGGYQIGGGGVDTTGYRAGVRGYAVPDLALSLQITDDNVYATNVVFGATWFIGRTNKSNGPCGTILDRFREPVLRNDFIATTSRRESRASGNALTENTSNEIIRLVHVDSSAGAGGDGTFENPFDQISDIDAANAANSLEGDIILVHADSTFTGADGVASLQNNQQLLGEGLDPNGNAITNNVDTNELGLIGLPETATGSLALDRPTITGTGFDVFTLADNNTINNFTINGANTGVTASGVAAPKLGNLQMNDVVNGIAFTGITGSTVVENTVEINRATGTALEVDGGEEGMAIAASLNDSTDISLSIHDRTGGTIDYTGVIDDRTAGTVTTFSDGIVLDSNVDSTINLTNTLNLHVDNGVTALQISNNSNSVAANSSIVNITGAVDVTATGTGRGVVMFGNDTDTNVTIADLNATAVDANTVDIQGGGTVTVSSADDTRVIVNTGTGSALFNAGDLAIADNNATVTVNSNITDTGGGSAVQILNRLEKNITVAGTVTATGGTSSGVLVQGNEAGTILFSDKLDFNTGANFGIQLVNNENAGNNTKATISFAEFDIETTTGSAFSASGGGNLLVSNANGNNKINVTGAGSGLNITDMTIDPGNVSIGKVDVTNGGLVGINLKNLDGTGQVNVGGGTNAPDGGTLSTTGTAIVVDNVNDVQLTNLTVTNTGGAQGVAIMNQAASSTATLNGLDVNTVDADAVVIGDTAGGQPNSNVAGTVAFNNLKVANSGTGDGVVISNNDASTTTMNINNMTVDATGAGRGFFATGGGTINVTGTNAVKSDTGTAFHVSDVENLTASSVTIDNSATAGRGLLVTGQNTNGDSVTLNNFNVKTSTGDAVTVESNTNGTVALNGLTAESTSGDTVVLSNNTGSTVNINGMTATATGSGNVFSATGGGTLSATGTNNVTANSGRGVNIENMTIGGGNVAFAKVDVTAAAGTAINLDTLTGGSVAVNDGKLTSAAAATTTAVNINNVDGTQLTGLEIDYTAGSGAGVVAANSAGDALTMSSVDVATSTGEGVSVVGGTFTATGTNKIATTTGRGLNLDGATIGGSGASLNTVDVTSGTTGIRLNNLTGGQVTIGNATTASTLNTSGDAITVTDAANVDLNNIDITTGAAGTGLTAANGNGNNFDLSVNDVTVGNGGASALVANHTGAGNFTMNVTNSVFNNLVNYTMDGAGDVDLTFNDSQATTSGADVAFTLLLDTTVTQAVVEVRRSNFTAAANTAFDFDSNSVANKDVDFVLANSTMSNNSANATAELDASGPTVMNATITTNTFTNTGAGGNFDLAANNAATVVNLLMSGNATNGGTDSVVLRELNVADFNLVDRGAFEANNGSVGSFTYDSAGNVIGDFDDIPVLP